MDDPTPATPVALPGSVDRGARNQAPDHEIDRRLQQRHELRHRHATALARLMGERDDLRGVLPLADLVDDALRWSA